MRILVETVVTKNKRKVVSILHAFILCVKTRENPFPFTFVCLFWNAQEMLFLSVLRPSGLEKR